MTFLGSELRVVEVASLQRSKRVSGHSLASALMLAFSLAFS